MTAATTYDAILFVSFGGPEGPDDVLPFMRNVTAGRGIPDERLAEVSQHYMHFGGVSPLNQQNRDLIQALNDELVARGITQPIYWGNRNWKPFINDAVTQMTNDGVARALAFATSAYSSYSGCRQYREDIQRAREQAGSNAPIIDKLRQYWHLPGFIQPMVNNVLSALDQLTPDMRETCPLVFTAHSIPMASANSSNYVEQLTTAAQLVAQGVAEAERQPVRAWELVYQSRSGAPHVPWLEPDVSEHLTTLAKNGTTSACVVPIGFISDHLEVLWDLDTQAQETANDVGITMVRAATVGTDPAFVGAIADMIEAGITQGAIETCPIDCCPAPTRP